MSGSVDSGTQTVILDSINDGVFTVDRDWRITSFNRAAERITGVPRVQALGRPCCEVFRASICERACALKETLAHSRPIINKMVYIVDAAGRQIPISISTAVLKDAKGRIIGGAETFRDLSQVEELRKELADKYTFADIIGRSPAMQRLFGLLPVIADSDSTVLIEGPSGTGKELVARAIHNLSTRKNHPFVPINCGALPDTLLESELFGHKAGAFTDARRDKPGRFALAEGGTVFLDEIGDVSPAMQVRLLRVLQDRMFEPLGAVQPVRANVRLVAATHRNLAQLVKEGKFREDLFYRVNVIRLELPALRDRREDIPLLLDHLVSRFNRRLGKDISGISPEALRRLLAHDYPGNVRELENILEHAFVLCRDPFIRLEHLPSHLQTASDIAHALSPGLSLQNAERFLLQDALRRHQGNRTAAAKELGIAPSTLFRKAKALGIRLPAADGRHTARAAR